MGKLIILRGNSDGGKTTVAKELQRKKCLCGGGKRIFLMY